MGNLRVSDARESACPAKLPYGNRLRNGALTRLLSLRFKALKLLISLQLTNVIFTAIVIFRQIVFWITSVTHWRPIRIVGVCGSIGLCIGVATLGR